MLSSLLVKMLIPMFREHGIPNAVLIVSSMPERSSLHGPIAPQIAPKMNLSPIAGATWDAAAACCLAAALTAEGTASSCEPLFDGALCVHRKKSSSKDVIPPSSLTPAIVQ